MSNTIDFSAQENLPSLAPPPQCMQIAEYAAADLARRRLLPKRHFFPSLSDLRASLSPKSKSIRKKNSNESWPKNEPLIQTDPLIAEETDNYIILDDSAIPDGLEEKDIYRWAIVYENQRG
jgi:hypothetical protein